MQLNLKKNQILTPLNIVLLSFAVFAIIIAWIRLSFGAEITDEAYYIADAKIITDGSVPIVTNPMQSPAFTLFYFWLIPLFQNITGGMDGIFLFMRQAYFIFHLLILISVFFLLKKQIKHWVLSLFLIALIAYSPGNTYQFSYNSIPLNLYLLIGALLIAALCNDTSQKKRLCFSGIAGFFAMLVVLAYPPQIFSVLAIGILLFVFLKIQKQSLKASLLYFSIAILSGICILVLLIVAGGGVENFAKGLTLLGGTYFQIEKATSSANLHNILSMLQHFSVLLLIFIGVFAGILLIFWFAKKKRMNLKKAAVVSLVLSGIGYTLYFLMKYYAAQQLLLTLAVGLSCLNIIFVFFIRSKKLLALKLLSFLWLPYCIAFIGAASSAYDGISDRWYILFIGSLLCIILGYFALTEVFHSSISKDAHKKANIPNILTSVWSVLLTICILISAYMFTYRDELFYKLDYKMESGIYQGIHTTKERGEGLLQLENEIKQHTSGNESVLFMETVPMAYLMTDAKACAPSTWDVMYYSYGFNDDTAMQEYFKIVRQIPDKIIYVNTGRDPILSIDRPGYKFNDFVRANYHLTYTTNTKLFPIKLYEKNT